MSIKLQQLWQLTQPEPFNPNSNQKRAILHIDSPLFLTAGPGSGKTRVLLWRSLNLIVFHDVKPEEIFLSTFTEKAAFQLKEGLRSLLGLVTNLTSKPYDISKMYVGTVHSLCQKLLTDRRFLELGQRSTVPVLKDELGQYFYLSRHGITNLYDEYLRSLQQSNPPQADFSLIQQYALNFLEQFPHCGNIFKHIIIDEYQDTNTIQERIFFKLASGFKNICVVGDDDQALYRFRGATVENFVQFPSRCQEYLNCSVTEIPLNINYGSRYQIVEFYNDFITRQNWRTADGNGFYRLVNKNITAFNGDRTTSVIASTPATPDLVCEEIALLVRDLIKSGKVKDANQIAFLYPSLKSKQVERMIDALEDVGLKVYAPRARRFLEVEEAIAVFGVYLLIFGKPVRGDFRGADYNDFHQWLNKCEEIAQNLSKEDQALKAFIEEKREEINTALNDYRILSQVAIAYKWDKTQPYDPALMKRQLSNATGLSSTAKKNLGVDIIREQDQTIMYDIKTHDSDYVRGNVPEYEKQLNVYAHIWQGLRQQELDQTAIIATSLPITLRDAVRKNNQRHIVTEMQRWQPLIDIPFNQEKVAETINEFGQVVDAIESRQFQPPSLEKLKGKLAGKKVTFAVQVCRNCDARFSCSAYRRYVKSSSSQADSLLSRLLNDYGSDSEREDFLYGNLENIPDVESFDI